MTRTRTFAFAALTALGLAACGGVDREGTRDLFVEQLEAMGGEVDADCVDAALDKFDDDTLKEIDEAAQNGEMTPEVEALTTDLLSCVTIGS